MTTKNYHDFGMNELLTLKEIVVFQANILNLNHALTISQGNKLRWAKFAMAIQNENTREELILKVFYFSYN